MPRCTPCLALLAALACGGGGSGEDARGEQPEVRPPRGVRHLDPRLADGRSSARVLDRGRTILRGWTVAGDSPEEAFASLGPWTFENSFGMPPEVTQGLKVRAADYQPAQGITYAFATYAGTLDANEVNRVEVDLAHLEASSSLLTWTTDAPLDGVAPGSLRAETVTVGEVQETIAFDLSTNPGWRGTIRDLSLYPVFRGNQTYELEAIRFAHQGFTPGDQPGYEFDPDAGDGGLLGFVGNQRRTWPTDSGVPLYDEVMVPEGGFCAVDVGVPGALHDEVRSAHFAIDARRAGAAWVEVGVRRVDPGREESAADWHGLRANLGAFAGSRVELRFRAWLGQDDSAVPGLEGELVAGNLYWGSPMVIGAPGPDERPNLLLITLDTLRTDVLGCYGGPDITPCLDALAAEGQLFEEAWSACNSTLPSHTSLLTGLPVPTHGVIDNRSTLARDIPTLAQSLRAAGYHTAGAVSVEHLQAAWSGLGRGFDQYLDVQYGAPSDGAKTVSKVLAWNDVWAEQGERPLFLWLHLFDPHTPYGPPRPYLEQFVAEWKAAGHAIPPSQVDPPTVGATGYTGAGKFLEGVTNLDFAHFLYLASVAYTDTLVQQVVQAWRAAGRWDNTWYTLTADHGESFGEQGVYYGHQFLHTPVMRVPLITRLPGEPIAANQRRIARRVWSPDLVRTFVDVLGLEGLTPTGHNLLFEGPAERRVWFVHSELDQAGFRDGDIHFWNNRAEYLQLGRERAEPAGKSYLFRPKLDPGLLTNLADVEPDLAAKYANAMRAWIEAADAGRHQSADLTDAERARLEELGYGGGGEE